MVPVKAADGNSPDTSEEDRVVDEGRECAGPVWEKPVVGNH